MIYIIKENRTYDQIFGDLKHDGKQVGNGDPSLTMFGESITPNLHKLALQFGVLDNFFDSGEVSGDGHVWSNAAIGTDYLEKTWQQSYRGSQRTYDYRGRSRRRLSAAAKNSRRERAAKRISLGRSRRPRQNLLPFRANSSPPLSAMRSRSPTRSSAPCLQGRSCARKAIAPGEPMPAEWGGGVNKWPWAIPLIATNIAYQAGTGGPLRS